MRLYKCTIVLLVLSMAIGCGSGKIQEEVTLNPTLHDTEVKVPARISPPGNFSQDQVLVFSKTNGFRHKSIEKGVATFGKIGGGPQF